MLPSSSIIDTPAAAAPCHHIIIHMCRSLHSSILRNSRSLQERVCWNICVLNVKFQHVAMSLSLIHPDEKVLVVGDGNFSYSYDLAIHIEKNGGTGKITATSFDSPDQLERKYEKATQYIGKIRSMKHTVLHGVDATELVKSLHAQSSEKDTGKVTFDKVIFNFPLAPLTKTLADVKSAPSPDVVTSNRYLLWRFVSEASSLLSDKPTSGVMITSKKCKPYDQWRIKSLGGNCTQIVPFTMSDFHYYSARKVNIIDSMKKKRRKLDFSTEDSLTYIFQPNLTCAKNAGGTSLPIFKTCIKKDHIRTSADLSRKYRCSLCDM